MANKMVILAVVLIIRFWLFISVVAKFDEDDLACYCQSPTTTQNRPVSFFVIVLDSPGSSTQSCFDACFSCDSLQTILQHLVADYLALCPYSYPSIIIF
jgi:hypothetical protein